MSDERVKALAEAGISIFKARCEYMAETGHFDDGVAEGFRRSEQIIRDLVSSEPPNVVVLVPRSAGGCA
jgi:hypothetical protein